MTTPAKSIPSCGCCPSKAGVAAERDQHIGEVDAGCADRDLDLPRPRRNAVESGQFHCFQVTGRADLQAHARRARGRRRWFGVPRGEAERDKGGRCTTAPLRQAVSSSSDPLSSCRATCSASVGFIHVDLGGTQMRMFGADRPHQTAQPSLLQVGHVVGQHRLGVPGHEVQARRARRGSPAIRGRCAPDAARTRRPRQRNVLVGVAVLRFREDHYVRRIARLASCSRSASPFDEWSACCGQHIAGALRAMELSTHRSTGLPVTSAAVGSADSSHAPASVVGRLRQRLAAAIRWSAAARSAHDRARCFREIPGAHLQPAHGQQHRPVLVQDVEVSLDLRVGRLWSPASSSSGRCGWSRRPAAGGRPAAAADRHCRPRTLGWAATD